MLTFSDDIAVVSQRVDDLIPDPSDGNVDPIPHGNPESLELALLEADLGVDGGHSALLLGPGVRVLAPAGLEEAHMHRDLAPVPQADGVH